MAVKEEQAQTTGEKMREYRIERYRDDLNFTVKEAEALADATDSKGMPLYWGDVKKMLDAGCGHKLAVRILA